MNKDKETELREVVAWLKHIANCKALEWQSKPYLRAATLLEEMNDKLKEEIEIVNRVWKSLGCTTYEDAKPYTIWEHVDRLKAELELKNEDLRVTNSSADFHIKECQRLREEFEKAKAACAVKQERLSQLLEVAEFIDNEDKHQTKAIKEALADNCGQPLLDRLERLDKALGKLARLGNEPEFGNSIGNIIAREALAKINENHH